MKTLTKKAIVLASAIAVAGAFAVCAADPSYSAVEPTAEGKSVTVDFSTTVAETDQITMLAYYVGEVDLGPNEENIVFIEQLQKSEAGNSITFSLRDDDPTTGTYKVLMGGTGVEDAGFGTFTLEEEGPAGATISGTVDSLVYFGDPEGDEFMEQLNADYQTTATLWSEEWSWEMIDLDNRVAYTIVDSTTGEFTGDFTFEGVEAGTYFLSLSRAGKCTKVIMLSVSDEDIELGTKELLGADANEDFEVSALDVGIVVEAYLDGANREYGSDNFIIQADNDANAEIGALDIGATVESYLAFNSIGYQEVD